MPVDWKLHCVQTESGGWMRLADYCNSTERGWPNYLTTEILRAEDMHLMHELGDRVGNYITDFEYDGWDALAEARYREHRIRELTARPPFPITWHPHSAFVVQKKMERFIDLVTRAAALRPVHDDRQNP